jgi:hypothetical protein
LAFLNSGTVPITGTGVIEVQDWAGEVVEEFRHAISGLPPANPVVLLDGWDTSNAQEGSYRVLGHVLCDAKATPPVTTFVTINPPVSLPTVLRGST